jgi:hypothetical protein
MFSFLNLLSEIFITSIFDEYLSGYVQVALGIRADMDEGFMPCARYFRPIMT